jgi:hypothetical protein
MRLLGLLGTLACLLAGAAHAATTQSRVVQCGSQSTGPSSIVQHTGSGARCFLAAYRNHCRAARYELRIIGIDTIATRDFTLADTAEGCLVSVTMTFRVVPQHPHPTGHGACRALRVVGSSIVATRCTGRGLAPTISLTATR